MYFDKKYKNQIGIYEIKNNITNKSYIGSTKQDFQKRFWFHNWKLNKNIHKNNYLQNSVNKYGIHNFNFNILEICFDKKTVLIKEQFWIDYFGHYNINPKATDFSHLPKEVIALRSDKINQILKKGRFYWEQVKNKKITIEDVPVKYLKIVEELLTRTAWNKGKKWKSTDHLKVPKTITAKVIKANKIRTERDRLNKFPEIYVYVGKTFLKKYRCAKDIEDLSNDENFELISYMKLRNKKGRNNKNPYFLASCNINKCANKVTSKYKGLTFSYAPLYGDI